MRNIKNSTEVRSKRYRVHHVELVCHPEVTPPMASIKIIEHRGQFYFIYSSLLHGDAVAMAMAVDAGETPGRVLGDYLEDHPSEVSHSLDAAGVAGIRWMQKHGVRNRQGNWV